ncbi:YpoC family protein [Litchfieldia salsa]|uniref:YpoC family protein n=1 Tax=Litchfieldia salsa TaxID=930152 RepID=UPI000B85A1F1|nr:hypothetical protein [Litchfieldia salsa]
MEQETKFKIPSDFFHPLFFSCDANHLLKIEPDIKETLKSSPFIFDIAFISSHTDVLKPWEEQSTFFPLLMELWNDEKKELNALFKIRDRKKVKARMIKALGYYVQFLNWSNGQAVRELKNWQTSISNLNNKPINAVERLEFIIVKPDQYHSFIQLSQLFEESVKQYYKKLALRKK